MPFNNLIILLLLFNGFTIALCQQHEINFVNSQSLEEIKNIAKESQKQIFINVYGYIEANSPSQWMVEDVFTDSSVAAYYNQHFVCVNLDLSYGGDNDLRNKYDIGQFPVFLFLDKTGELLHRSCGRMSPIQFIELGKTALDSEKRFSFYETGFSGGNRQPEFLRNFLKLLFDACLSQHDVLSEYWKTQKENELISRENWNVLVNYEADIGSTGFQNLLKNSEKFSSRYTKDSVDNKIYYTILNQGSGIINKEDFNPLQLEELLKIAVPISQKTKAQMINHLGLLQAEKLLNWNDFGNLAVDYCENYNWEDAQELNAIAWKVFVNIDDPGILNHALKWSKQSVDRQKGVHQYHDTYAAILFKLKKYDDAEVAQQRAISLAKEVGAPPQDIEDYLSRLENIKKGQAIVYQEKIAAESAKKSILKFADIRNQNDVLWACETTFNIVTDYRDSDYNNTFDDEHYMKISEISTISLKPLKVFTDFLFDAALSGKEKSFSSIYELEDQKFTDPQYYLQTDTVVEIEPGTNKEKKVVFKVYQKEFSNAIGLDQEWYFDQKENKIKVKVNDVQLKYGQDMIDHPGRLKTMCYFSFQKREQEIFPVPSSDFLSLPDIVWASGFSLDLHRDTFISDPQIVLQRSLKSMFGTDLPALLFTLVKNCQIPAYYSPETPTALTNEEITRMTTMRDTVAAEDPNSGDIIYMIDEKHLTADQITALRIKQLWYFNTEKFQIESKIRSIAILRTKVNGMGERTGYEPLFWIKYD